MRHRYHHGGGKIYVLNNWRPGVPDLICKALLIKHNVMNGRRGTRESASFLLRGSVCVATGDIMQNLHIKKTSINLLFLSKMRYICFL